MPRRASLRWPSRPARRALPSSLTSMLTLMSSDARQRRMPSRHSAEPSSASLVGGTPAPRRTTTMIGMGSWPRAWVLAAVLGLAAVIEASVRAAVVGLSPQAALGACLLALATTVPLAVLGPTAAAAAICAATVISLVAFHTLTVAALVALLIALCGLGRTGAQLPAAVLASPFLVLALAGPRPTTSEAGVLTVLLAALAPAAAWAGIAYRAHRDAAERDAARQAVATSLLDHTARGERARIARELHDVVAHHISVIAVQAETARLTTPGLPAAGAQKLSAIGDTARAGLTEMRRLLGVLREDANLAEPDLPDLPGPPARPAA